MTSARRGYRTKYEDNTLTLGDIEDMLNAWDKDIEDLELSADAAAEKDSDKINELEEKLEERRAGPEWGNCKRGCPPSYLDRDGYCSPACKLGFPRGEYVTVPRCKESKSATT